MYPLEERSAEEIILCLMAQYSIHKADPTPNECKTDGCENEAFGGFCWRCLTNEMSRRGASILDLNRFCVNAAHNVDIIQNAKKAMDEYWLTSE